MVSVPALMTAPPRWARQLSKSTLLRVTSPPELRRHPPSKSALPSMKAMWETSTFELSTVSGRWASSPWMTALSAPGPRSVRSFSMVMDSGYEPGAIFTVPPDSALLMAACIVRQAEDGERQLFLSDPSGPANHGPWGSGPMGEGARLHPDTKKTATSTITMYLAGMKPNPVWGQRRTARGSNLHIGDIIE